jgi:ABC-type nitrate/sulfonate/bicarbonate transport system substrate-binding protein
VYAGVVTSSEYLQAYPHTLRAVLRLLKRAIATISEKRDKTVPTVAKEMKLSEETGSDNMALDISGMAINEKICRRMGEFVDFL